MFFIVILGRKKTADSEFL